MSILEGIQTSRTRERTDFQETHYWARTKNGAPSSSGEFEDIGTTVTNDHVTPNFVTRVKQGEIIINGYNSVKLHLRSSGPQPYSNTAWHFGSETPYYDYQGTRSPYTWCGEFLDGSESEVDYNALVDQAVTAAYASVNNSDAQLLVMVAEANKSFDLVVSLCKRLYNILRKFKQTKKKLVRQYGSAAKASLKVSQAWLEVRYGIRPLIFEMQAVCKAIENVGKRKYNTYLGYASDNSSLSDTWTKVGTAGDIDVARSHIRTCSIRAGVIVRSSGRPTRSIGDTFGMANFMQMQWELVPYSFVVDWFLNTSQFVASWEPNNRKILGSFVTAKTTNYQRNVAGAPYNLRHEGSSTYESSNFVVGQPWISKFRSETERLPSPKRPLLPTFNMRLDTAKIVDMLALLRGLRR